MGGRLSKRENVTVSSIDQTTLEQLCRETGFSEEELNSWHRSFYKDCPDGKLTLRQFEHEYSKIMGKPTQKTANYIRHMFTVYDQDRNQFIDFKEFILALSAASVVNRLRLMDMLFHVFDLDNDGKITKDEISKMLHILVDVTDTNDKRRTRRDQRSTSQSLRRKQAEIQRRIDDAFNQLNANDDDHITKEEFIEWYMRSGLISDSQKTDPNFPDPSNSEQQAKKTRKPRRTLIGIRNKIDENDANNSNIRHMSRMIEKKTPSNFDDDDDLLIDESPRQTDKIERRNVRFSSTTKENMTPDTHVLRRNNPMRLEKDHASSSIPADKDRWMLIMHSILENLQNQKQSDTSEQAVTTDQTRYQAASSKWKRKVGDTMEMVNIQRKANGLTNESFLATSETNLSIVNDDNSTNDPDIVTVRF